MLLKYDITPIMVFDGGYLPLKAATEKNRRELVKSHNTGGFIFSGGHLECFTPLPPQQKSKPEPSNLVVEVMSFPLPT